MATLIQDTVSEKSSLSSQVEAVGSGLARYGLAIVVAWIGLMKFTAYEAEGISPFVAHSPLMSWVYGLMSVRGFSAVLGVVEVAIARSFSSRSPVRLVRRHGEIGVAPAEGRGDSSWQALRQVAAVHGQELPVTQLESGRARKATARAKPAGPASQPSGGRVNRGSPR